MFQLFEENFLKELLTLICLNFLSRLLFFAILTKIKMGGLRERICLLFCRKLLMERDFLVCQISVSRAFEFVERRGRVASLHSRWTGEPKQSLTDPPCNPQLSGVFRISWNILKYLEISEISEIWGLVNGEEEQSFADSPSVRDNFKPLPDSEIGRYLMNFRYQRNLCYLQCVRY